MHLDLVFLLDATASMRPFLDAVNRDLHYIISHLQHHATRIGLVAYRDYPLQSFITKVIPLTDDVRPVKAVVDEIGASGGNDVAEAVTDGLAEVVRLNWRENAVKVAVLVGDAEPHGIPESGGRDEHKKDPSGMNWRAQTRSCRECGIVVHAVLCGENKIAMGVFQEVARITHGMFIPLSEVWLVT